MKTVDTFPLDVDQRKDWQSLFFQRAETPTLKSNAGLSSPRVPLKNTDSQCERVPI